MGFCLICDSVREEALNKLTLLGFLGVVSAPGLVSLPTADVRLQDPNLPLGELTFIFIGSASGSSGKTDLAYEIFDWSDKLVFGHSQTQEVKIGERSTFVFNIRLLKFPNTGRYKIRMRVDGRPVYTGEFLISQSSRSEAGTSPALPGQPD